MSAAPFNKQNDITDVAVYGDTAHIDFWYPRCEGRIKYLHVGLVDVRASDGIRIHYDFDRDGYAIEQEQYVEYGDTSEGLDIWIEVAFIQSWQQKVGKDSPECE
jgi:hypothetical protein